VPPASATTSPARAGRTRERLRETLFPEAPRSERETPRWERAGLVAALLVLGTVLSLLRVGFSESVNTVWAEDGPIYLQGALTEGFWHAIFSPYAGYLVLVPRLIAELATVGPLEGAAAVIDIVSAFFAALSGLVVWHACGGHVRNPYLRATLALATVLAPAAGLETLDSAAYVPWFMLFASFWLLFWRPRTLGGAAAGGLFLLATGLSTPGVWFFMPVALLRAAASKDRRDAALLGPYLFGAVIQVPIILAQQQGEPIWTSHIWTAYLQRVVDGGLLGQRLGGGLWSTFGWKFLLVLLIAVLVGLVWRFWRSAAGARWFGVIAVLTSLAMFVLSAYQRAVGANIFWSPGASGGNAGRYVLVPALLLVSAAIVFVDDALRRQTSPARLRPLVGLTVGIIAVAIATSYYMGEPQYRGRPYWDDALSEAATKCVNEGQELAGIPTAPAPFGVQVPCEQVSSLAEPVVQRRAAQSPPG
jgi:hypothetical protein